MIKDPEKRRTYFREYMRGCLTDPRPLAPHTRVRLGGLATANLQLPPAPAHQGAIVPVSILNIHVTHATGNDPDRSGHALLFETTPPYVKRHAWPPMPFLEPLSANMFCLATIRRCKNATNLLLIDMLSSITSGYLSFKAGFWQNSTFVSL